MFSSYGISGQVFRGTLEEMNRVNALTRMRATRAIADGWRRIGRRGKRRCDDPPAG